MKAFQLLFLFLLGCQTTELQQAPPPPVTKVQPQETTPAEYTSLLEEREMSLLGSAETFFSNLGNQKNRAFNVALAASYIDQFEIPQGEDFSFNAVVGARSAERGFKLAPTILLGEIVDDLGGGTCQVSSTLFAAVVDAQQAVIERRPHSRVPKYAGAGRDAMVSFPPECQDGSEDPKVCVDFRFENTTQGPILIEARTLQTKLGTRRLRVEILGYADESPRTTTRWSQFSKEPFERKFRKTAEAGTGKKRKQKGEDGIVGALLVRQVGASGDVHDMRIRSTYKPVDEIWEVGSEWDDQLNPWEGT